MEGQPECKMSRSEHSSLFSAHKGVKAAFHRKIEGWAKARTARRTSLL